MFKHLIVYYLENIRIIPGEPNPVMIAYTLPGFGQPKIFLRFIIWMMVQLIDKLISGPKKM